MITWTVKNEKTESGTPKTVVTVTVADPTGTIMTPTLTFFDIEPENLEWAIRHELLDMAFSLLSDAQEATVRGQVEYANKWTNIAKMLIHPELKERAIRGEKEGYYHKYVAITHGVIC